MKSGSDRPPAYHTGDHPTCGSYLQNGMLSCDHRVNNAMVNGLRLLYRIRSLEALSTSRRSW